MEETLEQKKRRIVGKTYLNNYLKEINCLLIKKIKKEDLLSIKETDEIAKNKRGKLIIKDQILFQDKDKLGG